MEAFSKFVSIIILTIALFIIPMVYASEQQESISQSYVSSCVNSFVEQVKKQGKITQGMYDRFISDLDATNIVYDIEMVHTHTEVSPVFASDTSVESVKEYDMCYYTDEILDGIYEHAADTSAGEVSGEYHFSKGDYFTIVVTNKHYTLATRLKNNIYSAPFPKVSIYSKDGGEIQDENY